MNELEQLIDDVGTAPACDSCRDSHPSRKARAIQFAYSCKDCFALILVPSFTLLAETVETSQGWERRAEEALKLVENQNALIRKLEAR